MKRTGLLFVGVLFLLVGLGAGATSGSERDPLAVVQGLMDAERRGNLEAAMGYFAKEAIIVNATGRKTADRNELTWFIYTEIWLRDIFDLHQLRADGNRVTWVEPAVAPFYRDLGVAPVTFAFEAVVRDGLITTIVAYLPIPEIERIKEACIARLPEPRLRDRPCSEFVQSIEAHTNVHSTAALSE
jgi:hypothetical protein